MEIELLSPAKVNLFLKVKGKRDDGYHEILSLMQPVSLFDVVRIKIDEGDSLEVTVTGDDTVPRGEGNIAYKAAKRFLEQTGLKRSVRINIDKQIPAGAGLGGGSSNAATVLMGLNESLGGPLITDELTSISAEIGSDVPFFLVRGAAVASGRGEILEKISVPFYDYVIVNPGFEVSSSWAYENLDLTNLSEDNILLYSKSALMDIRHIAELLTNDLENAVVDKFQVVSEIKQALAGSGAVGSLMSGSGPTVFGVFSDAESASLATSAIKKNFGSTYKVFLVRGAG